MALPYAGNTYLYKRGYRRINGSGKQAYQNDNTENGRTHINWETLDMEFMRIVCYATTLVLSGRLEELRKVTESDTIEKTEV